MRLLDTNTPIESSCFRKNLPSVFVLIYPFTSQIFCINNDIMQGFTYSKKNRDDRLKYDESISHLGKMARTSAQLENPNRCVFDSFCHWFSIKFLKLYLVSCQLIRRVF